MPRNNNKPPIRIDAPTMDWSQNDGLYNQFLLWQHQCKLILSSDLEGYSNKWKILYNILRWARTEGLQIYNSWQNEDTVDDNLDNIWLKFDSYCIPQANAMHCRHELWHNIKHGTSSAEEYYATIINKAKVCFTQPKFTTEAANELTRDAFIFWSPWWEPYA